jgi:hypothetical protein
LAVTPFQNVKPVQIMAVCDCSRRPFAQFVSFSIQSILHSHRFRFYIPSTQSNPIIIPIPSHITFLVTFGYELYFFWIAAHQLWDTHLTVEVVVYISVDHSLSRVNPTTLQAESIYPGSSMTDGCKMSLVPTPFTIAEPPSLTCIASVNEARAMRIAEVLSDFRHLQHFIANIRTNPSAEEYDHEGYRVLRECAADAHALLVQPFEYRGSSPDGDEELEKAQLQRCVFE